MTTPMETLQVGSHGGENYTSDAGSEPKVGGAGRRPRLDNIAVSTNRSPVRWLNLGTVRLTVSDAFFTASRRSYKP